MSEITLKIDNLRSGDLAPLYCRYADQTTAQDAYIEIDEDGDVSADYVSAEVLGLDGDECRDLILDSLHNADNASGVVSAPNGRSVYAQH